MGVRSRRLALGRLVGTTQQVVYTVPADRTAVVRTVWLQNQHSATVETILSVRNSDTATVVRLHLEAAQARHVALVLDHWGVLEEGDDIRLQCSVTNVLNYWISGALLLGDPA